MRTLSMLVAAALSMALCAATSAGQGDRASTGESGIIMLSLEALPAAGASTMTAQEWKAFTKVLSNALESRTEWRRCAALRLAIQYSEFVSMDRSAIHAMAALYRNHRNDNVRRMAVVALASTDDSWAIDYLKRSIAFEKTPKVLYTIKAVLQPQVIVGEFEYPIARAQ